MDGLILASLAHSLSSGNPGGSHLAPVASSAARLKAKQDAVDAETAELLEESMSLSASAPSVASRAVPPKGEVGGLPEGLEGAIVAMNGGRAKAKRGGGKAKVVVKRRQGNGGVGLGSKLTAAMRAKAEAMKRKR